MLFWIMFASKKCLLITIIVLDNVLSFVWSKENRGMIMPEKSSIGFSGLGKLTFLVEISKFLKISKISRKKIEGCALAIRVIRAGTRLTVHRSLP